MSEPVARSASSRHDDKPVLVALADAVADGNTLLANRIIKENPALATERISNYQEADTVMDFICEKGLETVSALFEDVPGHHLHYLKDYKGRTPLHVAAEKGNKEVVRLLFTLCPDSIQELNSHGETPLHVSVKKGHLGCFLALMEQLQKPQYSDWVELLNYGDSEGNTLFHSAVSHKRVEILRKLVSYKKRYGVRVVDVNSRNGIGLTARDLHPKIRDNRIDRIIDDILRKVGAKRGNELGRCEEIIQKTSQENVDFMKISLLLGLLIFTASAAYQSLFSLSNFYPQQHHVKVLSISVKDAIRSPHLLPDIFYVFAANTIAYLGSISVILANTWSIGSTWSLRYRAVPLLVTGAMIVSYGMAGKIIIPKFWITVGSYKIPSFLAVWLLDFTLVFSSLAAWVIVKHIFHIASVGSESGHD